jgi:predicted RNA binding protein YcfA (HicA-like mRNA interferase family)
MHKEVREIVKLIEANGYTVEPSGAGHFIIRNAAGKRVWALPGTPGRGRWKQNLLSDLRKRGIIE